MKIITNSITTIFVVVFLVGCTSVPKDYGRDEVDALVSERGVPVGSDTTMSREEFITSLTEQPLTAESAIRIALANNPGLKATYASLGIAAADVYEAGRISNPIFSFSTLDSNISGERNVTTFGLITSFTDLVTLPSRKRFADSEFNLFKQSLASEILGIASEAEAAYYHFVAAKQIYKLSDQIAKTGGLSLALAKRYYQAGNISPRELAQEHAAASESRLVCLEAEAEAYAKRAELATVLGLSVADEWDSPAQLPVPLQQEDELERLLQLAHESRLDLSTAYTRTDLLADQLGVTGWTRWLGELDVGIEHEIETDHAELTGPVIEWEIPIFTQNRDKKLRAQAELKISMAEYERLRLEVDNNVRLAYAATLNTKSRINEYHKKLIPARVAIVERAQEEENFMLIGIFELLESKQHEYDSYQGYLEVVRDYWLARTELANAVGNTLPSSVNIGEEYINVEEYIAPKSSGMDHSQHNLNENAVESATQQSIQEDHSEHDMKQSTEMNSISKDQPENKQEDQPEDKHDAHSGH